MYFTYRLHSGTPPEVCKKYSMQTNVTFQEAQANSFVDVLKLMQDTPDKILADTIVH
jgi:hypothetical protein